jgi:uncharacterized protein (TIGR03032 family)
MRLDRPLVQLPLRVDAARLAAELAAIDEGAWRDHPEGAPGNTALPLVAAGGDPEDDSTRGPMAPTPVLAELPYTRQVLAGLHTTIGRTRFMRIADETELHSHVDTNYYWWNHLRVHVPIVTTPEVVFEVDGASTHMGLDEVWVFDTWRPHRVDNPASASRIHLVIDTVGGSELWDLIADPDRAPRTIEYEPEVTPLLPIETVNHPVVMAPSEMDETFDDLLAQLATSDPDAARRIAAALGPFRHAWADLYARFGTAAPGWPHFHDLLRRGDAAFGEATGEAVLPNSIPFARAARQLVFLVALNPDLAIAGTTPPVVADAAPPARPARPDPLRARLAGPPRIAEPIFIVSSPRSGSTLLFETLARAPELYSIGGESHLLFENIAALAPAAHDWHSNQLGPEDATEGVVAHLKDAFVTRLRDRDGARPPGGPTRLLEKTPKNALRVPFLAEAFPDARFVYLYRDPRETISSMLDAWRSGRFVTYPDLPGWGGSPWSLLLTPGWQELDGRPLAGVVASQWATTTNVLLDDLQALEPDRWCVASYDRLVADPRAEIGLLCGFLELDWDDDLADPLPNSRHTLDSPHPDKWQRNAEELTPHLQEVSATAERARQVFAEPPRVAPIRIAPSANRSPRTAPGNASAASDTSTNTPSPANGQGQEAISTAPSIEELFHSSHTGSLATLLRTIGASLLVTTYQAGRLILVRHTEAGLNTHFRSLATPMGVAYDGRRLAVGTKAEIAVFQNQPELGQRLDPPGLHDACFVIRNRHATGDIRVHDLAWADDGLWIVNTRFSCLATLDGEHSFVPRWRPPFVRALAAEDRCHLNGLAVVDGVPRFASVLGISDEANGWRENKATGGAIFDVPSSEVVAVGLSMPHSPRWHDGKLWVLESGRGVLSTIDVDTGEVHQVAQVPGFARGLAFAGQYALIGLSKVREHVFDGLPLTRNRTEELRCGVWVVDTTTGETVGYLAFEGLVQEIFEVTLLPHMRYPELVEPGAPLADSAYVLPPEALAEVPSTPG